MDPRRLVFLDEAGTHISLTRDYARAPRGERAQGYVPRNRGVVTTMLGALGLDGVRALMTVEGGTDADVFETFVVQVLVPTLKPGDIVFLDNVGAHKPPAILQHIRDAGASVFFLPPYSPDMNPIELCWSKLKQILKGLEARTREALDDAVAQAMKLITPEDAAAWFTHCGFAAQPD